MPRSSAVGYAFSNKGSTTSPDGYTGYYDTTLRDGTAVFPSPRPSLHNIEYDYYYYYYKSLVLFVVVVLSFFFCFPC